MASVKFIMIDGVITISDTQISLLYKDDGYYCFNSEFP